VRYGSEIYLGSGYLTVATGRVVSDIWRSRMLMEYFSRVNVTLVWVSMITWSTCVDLYR
jgi:hypothetical protein